MQAKIKMSCMKTTFSFIVFILVWFAFMLIISFHSVRLDKLIANNKVLDTVKKNININDIKTKIAIVNKEEKILNEERFGPLQSDSLVIAVQVHSRIQYLKYLISSLRAAHGISNVLLIFSHDFFDEEINDLIESIDFCKVMQIFYPFSAQIYPNEFPGKSWNDCSEDESFTTVNEPNTNWFGLKGENGTCRRFKQAQVKHHWWWKANKIFNMAALERHEGLVLFLEEDFYVVEDFIPVLELMGMVAKEVCKQCKLMSLAVYTKAVMVDFSDIYFAYAAVISKQFSDMGLAFTRATWLEILECKFSFCCYNEYNWDFSLKNVFTTCMKKAMAMTINLPRVFHLGTCGMHFKADNCDPSTIVSEMRKKVNKHRNFLYPKYFNLIYGVEQNIVGGPYGGWSDLRDQILCLEMTKKKVVDSDTTRRSYRFLFPKKFLNSFYKIQK